MTHTIQKFIFGFGAVFRAPKYIFQSPKVFSLILIPWCINFVLYFFILKAAKIAIAALVASSQAFAVSHLPPWAVSGVGIGIAVAGWLAAALVVALSFTTVSALISSPFNDLVCKAVYKHLNKNAPVKWASGSVFTTLGLELRRLTVLIGMGTLAVLIGFVPLLQIPAFAIAALALSFEYLGYPVSLYSHHLRDVRTFIAKNFAMCLGFGCSIVIAMAIPFASLIVIPLSVVAATELYFRAT